MDSCRTFFYKITFQRMTFSSRHHEYLNNINSRTLWQEIMNIEELHRLCVKKSWNFFQEFFNFILRTSCQNFAEFPRALY